MIESPTSLERLKIHAIHTLFNGDERLLQTFFDYKEVKLRSSPAEMLNEARAFDHREFLLVQIALDLWCGEGDAKLSELMSTLDDRNVMRVLKAITYKREMVEVWEALLCCE